MPRDRFVIRVYRVVQTVEIERDCFFVRDMAESVHLPPITKLKGRENYATWRIAMESCLQMDGLWKAVQGTEQAEDKRVKAKAKIILSVDETLYVHVASASTASEAWKNLKKAFEDRGLTRKVGLLRKITTTKLENCDSMEGYINEIMSAVHQLTSIGFEINQEWLGTVLLAGLPERYQPMIMALEESGMRITGDSVKAKLLQETICYNKVKLKNDSDLAYHVKRRTEHAKPKQGQKKLMKCWSCGKVDHLANEYDNRKKEEGRHPDREKKKSGGNAKVAFLANEIGAEKNQSWIVNSAASAHMSPNKAIFNSFIELRESKVIVADNTRLQVKGSGMVNIPLLVNGEANVAATEDVLYVPRLSVNLLSVQKITEKGFTIKFDRETCEILDGGDVIAIAKPVDGVYKLSQPSNIAYSCKLDSDLTEWHRRLGHLNRVSMKLLRDKHAYGLKFDDPGEQPCEICVKGKQTRQ